MVAVATSRILNLAHNSHSGNDLCGTAGAGLRQLPERVPEPLARGRERGHAPLPLPQLQSDACLVGEPAAGQLAGPAWPLPHLPRLDRLALSASGGSRCCTMGNFLMENI